jgi:hypothetical protein
MVTYYKRRNRKQLWQRINDFLDRTATVDQIIGGFLAVIIVCSLSILVIEAAPRILPAILAWITK